MTVKENANTQLNKAKILWNLSRLNVITDTQYSITYHALQDDRKPMLLVGYKPAYSERAQRCADLLDYYGGDGTIKHFGSEGNYILLEYLDGKKLAVPSLQGRDEQSMTAITNLVGMLHVDRPHVPANLVPLKDHLSEFFKADVRLWPDTARDLYARSVGIAYSIFDRPHANIPLHGNVNHDRIALSDRGWLAFSPVGLIGDPAYDLASSFIHPWGNAKLCCDPNRINTMADIFSQKLGYNRKRILAFAAIFAANSACEALQVGEPINWELAVLPNLLSAYDVA